MSLALAVTHLHIAVFAWTAIHPVLKERQPRARHITAHNEQLLSLCLLALSARLTQHHCFLHHTFLVRLMLEG